MKPISFYRHNLSSKDLRLDYFHNDKNFLTYGIAFSFQQAKTIPVHKNDAVLKGVITEEGSVIN